MTGAPRFRIFLAGADDTERLKNLYSEKSSDGSLQINLNRDPDFFEALRVEGYENSIYAVEDTETGRIAGAGIRNLRECYINGKVKKIGYLSGLRVAEKYRKSRAMAMIFIKLRELYLTGECDGYLTSVFESNTLAMKVLTSGKAGMPLFKKIGSLNTFVFKPVQLPAKKDKTLIVRQAKSSDIEILTSFLKEEGSKQQFFPSYTISDFNHPSGILKDLKISDIYLAFRNNEIAGCLALWDQTGFRKWKVEAYSPFFKLARPILNWIFHYTSFPGLPPIHASFNYRIISMVCIRDNEKEVFASLYNKSIQNVTGNKTILISAGFFDNDQVIRILPYFKMSFKSSIFIGNWKETQSEIDSIDKRFPYIETGSL
jgi:hypothetical protein